MPVSTPPDEANATAQRWELWLKPLPKSVSDARRHTRAALAVWQVPGDAVDTTALIVSELLTNAIRHCDSRHLVQLRVIDNGDSLLIEVDDPDTTHPRPVIAPPDAENGRGLLLVRAGASAFGARGRQPFGKTVWATVETGERAW
ncbi:ATP-binding protein [Streptomyces sp. NPDC051976]|uniref:ATP-binding protein n=1 Tax=Streptomyces sp. NPDC051976 TaxID=3154947 RepID=UPI00344A0794